MDQAPDASDRIVDDRAMRRFQLAIPGRRYGSRLARAVLDFSSGLHGIALPGALQLHSRSAYVRFAAPLPGVGRAPNLNGIHQKGPGEDDAVRAS